MTEAEGRRRYSIIPGSLILGYELQRFAALLRTSGETIQEIRLSLRKGVLSEQEDQVFILKKYDPAGFPDDKNFDRIKMIYRILFCLS